MRKIRQLLPVLMMVSGLTIGASALQAQPAEEAATAGETAAAPEVPAAAPEAPATAPEAPAAPAATAADTAPDVAPDAEAPAAPAAAGDPPSKETIFAAVRRLIETKDWAAGLAALALIFAYGFSRKTWVKKVPGIGPWIATNDFGGVVGAFVAAFLGAWGTAFLAGGDLFATATLTAAFKVGIGAAGGYGGIWKKMPWFKTDDPTPA